MQILFMGYESTEARLDEAQEAGYTVNHHPGPFDAAEQADVWKGLRNAPPDIVWLRWEALGKTPDTLSIRRFRVARTTTRIIVEVPDDHQPPDAGLADLVSAGIYDITGTAPLKDILNSTLTYADAARWQGLGEGVTWDDTPIEPKIIEKERVVIRPTSTRTTIIACWSSVPGAGGTTLAMAVARTLSQYGTVAVLDHGLPTGPGEMALDGQSGLAVMGRLEPHREGMKIIVSSWEHDDQRHTTAQSFPDPAEFARMRRWDYLVCDGGVPGKGVQEPLFQQADLNLMLLPPVPSRLIGTWHWVESSPFTSCPNYRAVVFGRQTARLLADVPEADVPVTAIPWPGESEHGETMESLLSPVLPSEPASVRKAMRMKRWHRRGRTAGIVVAVLVLAWFGWVHGMPAVRHWFTPR